MRLKQLIEILRSRPTTWPVDPFSVAWHSARPTARDLVVGDPPVLWTPRAAPQLLRRMPGRH
eukprot:8127565-Alexandrium_andersonii.AAC.1